MENTKSYIPGIRDDVVPCKQFENPDVIEGYTNGSCASNISGGKRKKSGTTPSGM